MSKQMTLNDVEIALMLGLLKARDRELPLEIHHTDTFAYRHNLRDQQKVVDELVLKLETALKERTSDVSLAGRTAG